MLKKIYSKMFGRNVVYYLRFTFKFFLVINVS